MRVIFWFVLYAALFVTCYGMGTNSSEELYNLIISNHNKNIHPCVECDQPSQMNLTFYITSLNELHEVQGEIVTIGYIAVVWMDERINWTPTNFNNLTSMIMPSREVWHPKLIVGNPSRKLSTLNEEVSHVRVLHTGVMSWTPGDIFYTKCYPDIYYYPFDKQTCFISILPWGFSPLEIVLKSTHPSIYTPYYQDNGEWTLVNTWSEDLVDARVSLIRFYFTFKRRPEFLIANIILPIVFLNFLNALIFLIPTASGERVSCAVTVLLSFAVFISLVGDTIPKTSDPVPLLVYYLIAVFSGSGINMVCTILSVHIYYRDPTIPVTGIYRFLVVWTCTKTKRPKTRTEVKVGALYSNDENGKATPSKEADWTRQAEDITWMEVSKCLDKVCLFVSIVHFIICTVVQLLIVPNLTD